MKKFMVIATVISLLFMLTACSGKTDTDFAYVEITTSAGTAYVDNAYHGNNGENEEKRQYQAVENPTKVKLADGDTATIHFHCNQCGYDEMIEEVAAPYARLFYCECSGTLKEANMKEYLAVIIGNASLEDIDP